MQMFNFRILAIDSRHHIPQAEGSHTGREYGRSRKIRYHGPRIHSEPTSTCFQVQSYLNQSNKQSSQSQESFYSQRFNKRQRVGSLRIVESSPALSEDANFKIDKEGLELDFNFLNWEEFTKTDVKNKESDYGVANFPLHPLQLLRGTHIDQILGMLFVDFRNQT
jgi:hypothetical protein